MKTADKNKWVFQLFISHECAKTDQAVAMLKEICDTCLKGRYDIEVINVLQDPAACIRNNIIATPTLLKLHPEPAIRIIGDLTVREKLISTLGLQTG